jgi:hypothetical protein
VLAVFAVLVLVYLLPANLQPQAVAGQVRASTAL